MFKAWDAQHKGVEQSLHLSATFGSSGSPMDHIQTASSWLPKCHPLAHLYHSKIPPLKSPKIEEYRRRYEALQLPTGFHQNADPSCLLLVYPLASCQQGHQHFDPWHAQGLARHGFGSKHKTKHTWPRQGWTPLKTPKYGGYSWENHRQKLLVFQQVTFDDNAGKFLENNQGVNVSLQSWQLTKWWWG